MAATAYSLAISSNLGGEFCQNVFKYSLDDSGFSDTASAANALITAFVANSLVHLQNITPTATTYTSIKARAIDAVGGFEAVQLLPGGTTGARTGTVQNTAVSPVLIWFPTNNAKTRGKTFLVGISDSDLVDGFFQTAYKNQVATQAPLLAQNLILAGGGAPTASFIIRQKKPVYSLLPVQYVNLSNIPGTLRKRQRPA